MKRLLIGALASLFAIAASATTLNPVGLLNPTGSTSGQAIVSTGASSAPAWGNVSATALAAQAANTVIGNATASSASPTPITVTGCNGAAQALQWTNGSGFGCNSGIATSGANSNITSLSGLSTALSVSQGGTGATSSASALTNLGAAPTASPTFTGTVTAAALTASGLITPSSTVGIKGTTTNDSAQAGSVGEIITATASGVAQTSATLTNITSVSLTAGDWDVTCSWTGSPATSTTGLNFGLTTTSAAQAPIGQRILLGVSTAAGIEMSCPSFPLKLASTTTLYLTSAPTFSGSMTVGGTIWAIRRR